MPDDFEGLKCLRRLSLQDCFSLPFLPGSIGRSVTTLPDELDYLECLINPWQLKSVSDLSNSTALEELNVGNCRNLATIPGLQNLRSLKLLYMNGCWDLDVHKIWSQLKEAAFDDLQAFSIGSAASRSDGDCVDPISLPFPRGGCMRNEHLQLEKMDVFVWKNLESETMYLGDRVQEDDSVLNVGVAVGSCLFPAARPQMALRLRASQLREDSQGRYRKRSYTVRFGKGDEINRRLRVEATSVPILHISCQDRTVLVMEAAVWIHT
ncbi:uncharacterized protein LOC126409778 [Nymphaea colorata]|nr:uncharacterized protein LOC126409778 [Nymphaea colorata]XP_049931985.1 uncharacterized protein LOC126409778 [Nymphaea colorata]